VKYVKLATTCKVPSYNVRRQVLPKVTTLTNVY